ncbi:MAG: uncharacterized protein QG604_623 [Candidatus Dependentiae bacterium]|nr:uncharacterized protein [Candidatus Dependentiae bacterium]
MRRLYLSLLLFISCATIAISHVKVKESSIVSVSAEQQPLHWLIQSQQYIQPATLPTEVTIDSLFGPLHITEPLLIELITHPILERMRDVDQHGPATHFGAWPTFSRYDHSIGVFALLHLHNRPLIEQVAGLLHDASHTAFSHTADHLFKTGNEHAYQDSIHNWYLTKMGLDKLLARYGLTIEEINPDRPEFTALEQKSPKLCADRIHYNFHAGLVHGLITQEELHDMAKSLHFENDAWFFSNQEHGRKLADISLYYTEHCLACAANLVWHCWLCKALEQAAKLKLITLEEIHFGTDSGILKKLANSSDPLIIEMLKRCHNPHKHYCTVDTETDADLVDIPKLRAIDPLIKIDGDLFGTPLTLCDDEYRKNMNALRQHLNNGIKVRFAPETALA